MFCLRKKKLSQSFKISGTLIVKLIVQKHVID
jgi:hypothetical protein